MASTTETIPIRAKDEASQVRQEYRGAPLKLAGALDSYKSFDVTPVIGREFPEADLKEWLDAPNSDELLRDLAITSEFCRVLSIPSDIDLLKSPSAVSYSSASKMV